MLTEIDSDYVHKYELLRNYVHVIIHEAMKTQPADSYFQHSNASSRIVSLFVELLERQFPIDSPDHVLKLKTASDYAVNLSVHANHLNRVVKEMTGKTTTEHIADRIVKEAKALLLHTNWNISEIGYSLGFEYPAYFNNFFKKQTMQTPRSFRAVVV
jgi:AraC-like DNA-binding protein